MAQSTRRLGPLELEEKIGIGRHCQIWSAVDGTTRKRVAVKFVVAAAADDPAQRKLLEHELKVARSMSHPGVIRIDRFELIDRSPLLVMELFPHPNLKQQIAGGIDPIAARLPRILNETALAVAHVHARGWVHRDLKPDNVLAAEDGRVKLIDLAIATRASGVVGRLLGGRGPVQGSPSYMAPEQIRGRPVGPQADVYSFGCMAYELLCGRPPFQATDTNDLLNRHLSTPPPPVEKFNNNVTTSMSKLLKQMLAKKASERPASMKQVLDALRSVRLFERAATA
jgi:eukaryotic-like serine/threonine-protein kinase